jgi:nucleoid DNA-binding protein
VIEADATRKPKADALTRGDLLARVKASAGEVNGQFASAIMDIVLLELGQALRDGKTVKALPVGNLVVQKRKPLEDGEVLKCKLRIKDPKVENPDDVPAASDENGQ